MKKVSMSAMGWHISMPGRPSRWGRVRMSGMKQTPCRQQARNVARPDLPMLWNSMLATTMTGCKNMARHW